VGEESPPGCGRGNNRDGKVRFMAVLE